jgi:hypothetical protein
MLRFLITASLLSLVTVSHANASNLGCNPAVQNWTNGSGKTCPFDSKTAENQPDVLLPTPAPAPTPTPVVEETPPEPEED